MNYERYSEYSARKDCFKTIGMIILGLCYNPKLAKEAFQAMLEIIEQRRSS